MPTTLTGLLIFVVLLLPGFAYLVGKERYGTERQASPFRETVAIVAASVTSELLVLVLFVVVRLLWRRGTPDVGALISYPGLYLRGGIGVDGHYGEVAGWGVGLLTLSVVCAYLATVPAFRRRIEWLPFVGRYPHESTVSAWWILFEHWRGDRTLDVGCVLEDGSYVRGNLQTFNNSADDSPDRELILREPIRYRPPGESKTQEYPAGAVCISARRIVAVFVNYADELATFPSEGEDPAGEASRAAARL